MTTVVEQLQLLIDERLGHLERIVAIDRTLADARALLEATLPAVADAPVQESRSIDEPRDANSAAAVIERSRAKRAMESLAPTSAAAAHENRPRTLGDVVAQSLARDEEPNEDPAPPTRPTLPEPDPTDPRSALSRAEVLRALDKHGPTTCSALAAILDRPKPHVYSHLHQSKLRGDVVRNGDGAEALWGTVDQIVRHAVQSSAPPPPSAPEPQPLRAKDHVQAVARRCSRCIGKFESTGEPYCPKCTPIVEQERRSRQAGFARTMPTGPVNAARA